MTTLVLTITITDIEKKYGYPAEKSGLPPTEEVVQACTDGPDHLMWLLEQDFKLEAEYV